MRWSAGWPLAACLALASCAGGLAPEEGAAESDAAVAQRYDDFPPGAPQRCVSTRQIRTIEPVGNHSLLVYLENGDAWRSRLRNRCLGLRPGLVLSYELRASRLCAGDIVTLLENFGGSFTQVGACAFGEFDYLSAEQAEAFEDYQ